MYFSTHIFLPEFNDWGMDPVEIVEFFDWIYSQKRQSKTFYTRVI